METSELLELIGRGEDSRHQFKEDVTNASSLAAEMAAFANSGGGQILIGVGDDIPISGTSVIDLDLEYFRMFFRKRFEMDLENQGLPLVQVLTNMRLLKDNLLTTSGALLFAKDPPHLVPAFHVKAVCYPGTDIHAETYQDSEDILGKIEKQFKDSIAFILRNLRRGQNGQGVNTAGVLEIPRIVFEELIANAIIHRDYFVSAPIRVFVFDNRIEIISPGVLPNNLTVENIRSGNSNMRNPILASYATYLLPYRGLGNGILRAIKEYSDIDFIDDRLGNKFTVVVARPPS